MARSKAKTTRTRKAKTAQHFELPKGYEAITGGYGINWPGADAEPGALLQGVIGEVREVQQGKGKEKRTVQVMSVEGNDGKLYSVWESAGLRELFEYEEGTEFAALYVGMGVAKRGQNAPRLYKIGVK